MEWTQEMEDRTGGKTKKMQLCVEGMDSFATFLFSHGLTRMDGDV